jgi:hypothetical protein
VAAQQRPADRGDLLAVLVDGRTSWEKAFRAGRLAGPGASLTMIREGVVRAVADLLDGARGVALFRGWPTGRPRRAGLIAAASAPTASTGCTGG